MCGFEKLNFSELSVIGYVTDANGIFSYCSKIKEINVINFNTNNAIDISYMFSNCSSL